VQIVVFWLSDQQPYVFLTLASRAEGYKILKPPITQFYSATLLSFQLRQTEIFIHIEKFKKTDLPLFQPNWLIQTFTIINIEDWTL